jgi:hypothetical protein
MHCAKYDTEGTPSIREGGNVKHEFKIGGKYITAKGDSRRKDGKDGYEKKYRKVNFKRLGITKDVDQTNGKQMVGKQNRWKENKTKSCK